MKLAALLLLFLACGCSSTPSHRYVATRAGVREVPVKDSDDATSNDGVGQFLVALGNYFATRGSR